MFRQDFDWLNSSVFPEVDKITNWWKVDLEDLKGWLTETIDKRVQTKTEEIDKKYEDKYKAVIVKQK